MAEFTLPAFLQKHSTDDIHEKMRAILPPDLDMSEGGHAWNMTRHTALGLIAELQRHDRVALDLDALFGWLSTDYKKTSITI